MRHRIVEFLNQGSDLKVDSSNLSEIAEVLNTELKMLLEIHEQDAFEESLDYLLEGVLESLTGHFESILAVDGPNDKLKELIRERFLFIDGDALYQNGLSPNEIIVRASECLAELSRISGESSDAIKAMIVSDDWRYRVWGARTIKSIGLDNAEELLASLKDDPYMDEDGYHLVREAAGFSEDD